MKAVILIGGPNKGTRFRPLSLDVPKPLFPIAGKPMIYHHIEACAQLAGFKEVLLLGYYNEALFTQFAEETSKELNIKIRYINEVNVLGTAGGLYHFRNQILEDNPSHIFVLHADLCCAFPLKDLLEFHKGHGGVCSIMSTKVPREYAHHYGCLVKDETSNELLHYTEKPESFVSELINCGVYCFSAGFFDIIGNVMAEIKSKQPSPYELELLGERNGAMRLEQDIFEPLAGTKSIFVFQYNGFWRQIKNAGASVYATDLYTKHYAKVKPQLLAPPSETITGNVVVHPTAEIHPSARIGPNVTIGANVKIGKGVRIAHSIILDGTEIKDRAAILYSILGWESSVGAWTRIEGIPNYTPFLYHQEKRQGITIFGKGAGANREIIVRNCIVMPHKTLDHSHFNEILL